VSRINSKVGQVFLIGMMAAASLRGAGEGARVAAWPGPGGDVEASPNYDVTVTAAGATTKLFTYYTYNRPYDKTLDREGKYIKLSFLAMHSTEYAAPSASADTYAHSWAHFDFSGGPVDVKVRILTPGDGLTMPLSSCAVLPSSYGVTCRVVGEDAMAFTLEKPAKVAVVANPVLAAEKLAKLPRKATVEGYRNPLFLFARAPETAVPDKTAPGTLVVKPGDRYKQADFAKASLIYFEPGVHDYSRVDGDLDYYLVLQKGQTAYLAGGAYVYANVRSDLKSPISAMPLLRGRGTLSGAKQRWTDVPYQITVVKGIRMDGIQITDAHNHITHTNGPIRDVAIVGAWHGNTDGPTLGVPKSDPYTGIHVEDCFVMAADTNLKLEQTTRVRNYTVWQQANAEPLWIRAADGVTLEDFHVIAANSWGRGQIFNVRAAEANERNATVRNATVEAPFAWLLFFMPSDYKGSGLAFDNLLFENVTVTTPHLGAKSPIGAATGDPNRFGKVVFRNLVINGTRVTADNYKDYFEPAAGITVGREVVFE
jgi:hypothetical protein